MSGITKNRKRVTAANANKKQKKSKKKVSINAAELEEMVSRQNFFFYKNMLHKYLSKIWNYPISYFWCFYWCCSAWPQTIINFGITEYSGLGWGWGWGNSNVKQYFSSLINFWNEAAQINFHFSFSFWHEVWWMKYNKNDKILIIGETSSIEPIILFGL